MLQIVSFILLDINNEIWFKLKDIYNILGYVLCKKKFKINNLDKHDCN